MCGDVRGSIGIGHQILEATINVESVERVAFNIFQGGVVLNSIGRNMTTRFILVSEVDGGVEGGKVETMDTHFHWTNFDQRVEDILS